MAFKDAHDGAPWPDWEPPLRDRDPEALELARGKHAEMIAAHECLAVHLLPAMVKLHEFAKENNIKMIGESLLRGA